MLKDLILKNRSYRRFYQSEKISKEYLREWIDLARNSASARNAQTLKYVLSNNDVLNAKIFELLTWAGYFSWWHGPEEGERPSAYIVVLSDSLIAGNYFCDDGIAIQSILLGATEAGYGGCIIHSVNRNKLREILQLTEQYEILYVIALGKPKETVVLEEISEGDFKYWRDENQVHHVPKRGLDEIILEIPE
ncbi:MAG: nitroreductase family protein [Prolixibacteraceae bacterium]|jgi:nitroreductase